VMVIQTYWGERLEWVEMSADEHEAKRRARTLRHTEGVGKVRVFRREVRAASRKFLVWVVVCEKPKGAGDGVQ